MTAHGGGVPQGAERDDLDGWDAVNGESEFFDRAREVEQLRAALRSLRRGRLARWLIQGEGGIGKSRLIAEAISGAEHGGVAIYTGRAS